MESVELKKNIMLALDEIRPFLASDGGDISLVSIKYAPQIKKVVSL